MEINQREVVALLRLCSTLNPTTSLSVRHFLLEVSKFLARTDAVSRYPAEVALLRHIWDNAFAAEYAHARAGGMTRTRFFEAYADALRLLGPSADMSRLVCYRGDWKDERPCLKKVTQSSLLGQRMFAHALETTLLDDFSVKIRERLAFLDADIVTTAAIKRAKDPPCDATPFAGVKNGLPLDN